MTDIEILMLAGCTKREAEKHLNNGTTIFEGTDFETNFNKYMKEWDLSEEEIEEHKDMILNKEPATDWGIVEHDGKTWYIMYVL